MPSPIYHLYVINRVVSLPIGGGPSVFVNVLVWEHRTRKNPDFLSGKVYYSNGIIIIIIIIITFDVDSHSQLSDSKYPTSSILQ
jgi:hypothetical protein